MEADALSGIEWDSHDTITLEQAMVKAIIDKGTMKDLSLIESYAGNIPDVERVSRKFP